MNIDNSKDKSKIGIKTSNKKYREDSEKFNSNGTDDSEQTFDYRPASKNPSTNVEINMTQTNNKILQQTSTILLQTNNNRLTHPTSIKELEKRH